MTARARAAASYVLLLALVLGERARRLWFSLTLAAILILAAGGISLIASRTGR